MSVASGTLPPEIAFLARHGVPADVLRRAAAVAERCGVTADVAAIREGLVPEDAVYRALAAECGLPFLEGDVDLHPLVRFPEAARAGLAPLAPNARGLAYVYAPTGERLATVAAGGLLAPGFAIASPTVLQARMLAVRAALVSSQAADALPHRAPHLSYREGMSFGQLWTLLLVWFGIGVASTLDPDLTWRALSMALGLAFLAATIPRVAAPLEAALARGRRRPRPPDRQLPVYTIIVPLYREARVLPKLVRALSALDYPALWSKCTT